MRRGAEIACLVLALGGLLATGAAERAGASAAESVPASPLATPPASSLLDTGPLGFT